MLQLRLCVCGYAFAMACRTWLCADRIETSFVSLYIDVTLNLLFMLFGYDVCVQDSSSADATAEADVF